jgi:hypothetical protein
VVYTVVATSAPYLNRNRANQTLSRAIKLIPPANGYPVAEFNLSEAHSHKLLQEAALND